MSSFLLSVLATSVSVHALTNDVINGFLPDFELPDGINPFEVLLNQSDQTLQEAFNDIGAIPYTLLQYSCFTNSTEVCDTLTMATNGTYNFSCYAPDSLGSVGQGVCSIGCTESADCNSYFPGLGLMCDTDAGMCTPYDNSCTSNDNCFTVAGSFCNSTTNMCSAPEVYQCSSDEECGSSFVCYHEVGLCAPPCNKNEDCWAIGLPGAKCREDQQCSVTCASDADCYGDYSSACNEEAGICYPGCSGDEFCANISELLTCQATTFLNQSILTVKACLPNVVGLCSSDEDCEAGFSCLDTGFSMQCVPDCSSDSDCQAFSQFGDDKYSCTELPDDLGIPVPTENICLPDYDFSVLEEWFSVTNFEDLLDQDVSKTACKTDDDCSGDFECFNVGIFSFFGNLLTTDFQDLVSGGVDGCYAGCSSNQDCEDFGIVGGICDGIQIPAIFTGNVCFPSIHTFTGLEDGDDDNNDDGNNDGNDGGDGTTDGGDGGDGTGTITDWFGNGEGTNNSTNDGGDDSSTSDAQQVKIALVAMVVIFACSFSLFQ